MEMPLNKKTFIEMPLNKKTFISYCQSPSRNERHTQVRQSRGGMQELFTKSWAEYTESWV